MSRHACGPGHRYGLPIYCAGCGREIERCVGAHGDWMHSADRREACPAGGFARPEGPRRVEYNNGRGGRPRRDLRASVGA